jgi:hypothetical protein
MPITPHNPFKGRHYPGEVIVLCVRWYLRYPTRPGSQLQYTVFSVRTACQITP